MKFIDSINIKGDITNAVQRLRNKGILATDASDYANTPIYGSAAKSIKQGLWINLNHQYPDAVALLRNRNHDVTTSLTEDEMVNLEIQAKSFLLNTSNRFFNNLIKWSFYAVLVSTALYMGYRAVYA